MTRILHLHQFELSGVIQTGTEFLELKLSVFRHKADPTQTAWGSPRYLHMAKFMLTPPFNHKADPTSVKLTQASWGSRRLRINILLRLMFTVFPLLPPPQHLLTRLFLLNLFGVVDAGILQAFPA